MLSERQIMSKGCFSSPPKRKVFRFHSHSQFRWARIPKDIYIYTNVLHFFQASNGDFLHPRIYIYIYIPRVCSKISCFCWSPCWVKKSRCWITICSIQLLWPISQPPGPRTLRRSKGLIRGLIKGNQWLMNLIRPYAEGGGYVSTRGVGWPVLNLVGQSLCDRHGNGYRPGCAKFVPNPRGAMKKPTASWLFSWKNTMGTYLQLLNCLGVISPRFLGFKTFMDFKVWGSLKLGDEMLPFVMLGLFYKLGTSNLGTWNSWWSYVASEYTT